MMNFRYQIPGTDQLLDVDFLYEGPTGDGWNEPHEPATIYIDKIRFLTVDLTDMMSDRFIRDLEEAAFVYLRELADDHLL